MSNQIAILDAAIWVQRLALGSVALATATTTVAIAGMMMFTGRLHWRRGAAVILGCFLIFGAPVIGLGLVGGAVGSSQVPTSNTPPEPELPPPPLPPSRDYDPYAGAAPDRNSSQR